MASGAAPSRVLPKRKCKGMRSHLEKDYLWWESDENTPGEELGNAFQEGGEMEEEEDDQLVSEVKIEIDLAEEGLVHPDLYPASAHQTAVCHRPHSAAHAALVKQEPAACEATRLVTPCDCVTEEDGPAVREVTQRLTEREGVGDEPKHQRARYLEESEDVSGGPELDRARCLKECESVGGGPELNRARCLKECESVGGGSKLDRAQWVLSCKAVNEPVEHKSTLCLKECESVRDKVTEKKTGESARDKVTENETGESVRDRVTENEAAPNLRTGKSVHNRPWRGRHVCEVCLKQFPFRCHLKKHMATHSRRQNRKTHQCDTCHKCFRYMCKLKVHNRVHTGERPYACDVCRKRFHDRNHLNQHCRIHLTQKPYKCDTCQRAFLRKCSLRDHLRIHTGEKPFTCDVCGKSFRKRALLVSHAKTHMFLKPHKCGECNKAFHSKLLLRAHAMIHSGHKPFKCDLCPRTFISKSVLKEHHMTHTGQKPHVCHVCQKAFRRKSNLKNHMMLHNQDKPYQCHECRKTFSSISHLKRHALIHARHHGFNKCTVCRKSFSPQRSVNGEVFVSAGRRPSRCDACRASAAKKTPRKRQPKSCSVQKPLQWDVQKNLKGGLRLGEIVLHLLAGRKLWVEGEATRNCQHCDSVKDGPHERENSPCPITCEEPAGVEIVRHPLTCQAEGAEDAAVDSSLVTVKDEPVEHGVTVKGEPIEHGVTVKGEPIEDGVVAVKNRPLELNIETVWDEPKVAVKDEPDGDIVITVKNEPVEHGIDTVKDEASQDIITEAVEDTTDGQLLTSEAVGDWDELPTQQTQTKPPLKGTGGVSTALTATGDRGRDLVGQPWTLTYHTTPCIPTSAQVYSSVHKQQIVSSDAVNVSDACPEREQNPQAAIATGEDVSVCDASLKAVCQKTVVGSPERQKTVSVKFHINKSAVTPTNETTPCVCMRRKAFFHDKGIVVRERNHSNEKPSPSFSCSFKFI